MSTENVNETVSPPTTRSSASTATTDLVTDDKECSICCGNYSGHKYRKIVCPRCQKGVCMVCVKKYLLESVEDAHCMICKTHWNREFFDESLSQHFRTKEYRIHRENVLCEREKSRIPETQALYGAISERLKSLEEEQRTFRCYIAQLEAQLEDVRRDFKRKIENCKFVIRQRDRQKYRLQNVLIGETDHVEGDEQLRIDTIEKTKNLIVPCPNAKCRAYLNEKYVCDNCHVVVCKKCHVLKNEDAHVCKEDDIATIRQIRKDSRPCPGCGINIYKIDGCDQMWCTMCHTAFSWRTGEKVTRGQIHNPHFYEWKRNNGGLAAGAVDAQGCPIDYVDIHAVYNAVRRITERNMHIIMSHLHREIAEIYDTYVVNYRVPPDPTRRLRIDYIKGNITEETWKQELQRHEKRQMKKFETVQVYQMYTETMRDIFRSITHAENREQLSDLQSQTISLLRYVFDNLNKINIRYGSIATSQYARSFDDIAKLDCFVMPRT